MSRIYLDNNATTPIDPEVAEAVFAASSQLIGNPASQHWAGREARILLEDAREAVADALGARLEKADRVIFTSGGTEANNLALRGLVGAQPGEILVSAVEHPSILEPARALAKDGYRVQHLPVDRSGVVLLDALSEKLSPHTRLVSIMLANNETGVIQPVAQLAERCRRENLLFHTDAVQAVGKMAVSFHDLGVDAMSIAAHKFHGPVGIGVLLVRGNIAPQPILYGGFQQFGMRPGTETVALAVGMVRALTIWRSGAHSRERQLRALRDDLEQRLIAGEPSLVIHGNAVRRTPQTTCISFPGVDRQRLVIALDLAGIACSTGSACASGSSEPSHVLQAMEVEDGLVNTAIRLSVSCRTTPAEIVTAANRILLTYRDLRRHCESQKSPATARQRVP